MGLFSEKDCGQSEAEGGIVESGGIGKGCWAQISPFCLHFPLATVDSLPPTCGHLPSSTRLRTAQNITKQKSSQKNLCSSLRGTQCDCFRFMEFQSWKRSYIHLIDVFICEFREEKCLACSHRARTRASQERVSVLDCHYLWIPLHGCLYRGSVPEREREHTSTGQSGHGFSFPIAPKSVAYGILGS